MRARGTTDRVPAEWRCDAGEAADECGLSKGRPGNITQFHQAADSESLAIPRGRFWGTSGQAARTAPRSRAAGGMEPATVFHLRRKSIIGKRFELPDCEKEWKGISAEFSIADGEVLGRHFFDRHHSRHHRKESGSRRVAGDPFPVIAIPWKPRSMAILC